MMLFCPTPRKLVNLLVDVEEWGQVTLLNMLTRYARTQFIDPNIGLDFPCEVRRQDFGVKGRIQSCRFLRISHIRMISYFRLS